MDRRVTPCTSDVSRLASEVAYTTAVCHHKSPSQTSPAFHLSTACRNGTSFAKIFNVRVELGEICHFKAYVHPIMQFISLDISFHLILNHFSEIVSSFSEGSFKTPSAGNHLEL